MKVLLKDLNCPLCGKLMNNATSNPEISCNKIPTAYTFNDCLRLCTNCRVGYSNGKNNPTLVFEDPMLNVPEEFRKHLNEVLENSLNIQNKTTKTRRIGFNTSEDALSWTIFRHAQINNSLPNIIKYISGHDTSEHITIYYWGVPISVDGEIYTDKQEQLIKLLLDAGEKEVTLSEPDIIIEDNNTVIIFEVKLSASNDTEKASAKWSIYKNEKYFKRDITSVKDKYQYQLVRNWYIGNIMAEQNNKDFYLLNLTLKNPKENEISIFKDVISETDKRQFRTITWSKLLTNCFTQDLPQEIIDWLKSRKPPVMVSDLIKKEDNK